MSSALPLHKCVLVQYAQGCVQDEENATILSLLRDALALIAMTLRLIAMVQVRMNSLQQYPRRQQYLRSQRLAQQ